MFNWLKSLFAPIPPYVPTKTPEWKYVHTLETTPTQEKKMAKKKKPAKKDRTTTPRKEKKKLPKKKGK